MPYANQQALEYVRKTRPDATNAELKTALERAGYWGPALLELTAKPKKRTAKKK